MVPSDNPPALKDRRCFLWHCVDKDDPTIQRSAGVFTLPPDATEYPVGIKIMRWDEPGFYRQRPHQADQYDEFLP